MASTERSRHRPTGTSGPRPASAGAARAGWPGRRAARKDSVVVLERHGGRVRRAGHLRSKRPCSVDVARRSPRRSPFQSHQQPLALLGRQRGTASASGASGPRDDGLQQHAAGASTSRSTVAALEQVRRVVERADEAVRRRGSGPGSARTWRRAAAADVAPAVTDRPGSASSGTGAFCSANITWNSGVRLRSRVGLQLLHQLLEGHVLVLVGAQRRGAHLGQQLPEGRPRAEAARAAPAC